MSDQILKEKFPARKRGPWTDAKIKGDTMHLAGGVLVGAELRNGRVTVRVWATSKTARQVQHGGYDVDSLVGQHDFLVGGPSIGDVLTFERKSADLQATVRVLGVGVLSPNERGYRQRDLSVETLRGWREGKGDWTLEEREDGDWLTSSDKRIWQLLGGRNGR